MITDQLIVVEPGRIEVEKKDIDENIEPWEVLVETEYSIISAGTEGAGFTGLVKEMPFGDGGQYPRGTGYGNLGRVLKVGGQVVDIQPDDRVLSFSGHSTIVKADARRMVMPVPDDAPGEKLVFTDAYSEGWKPAPDPFMTAIILLEDDPEGGTTYTAIARHRSPEARKTHEDMGFFDGWGTVVTQLEEYAQTL